MRKLAWMTAVILAGCQAHQGQPILPHNPKVLPAMPIGTGAFVDEFDCDWVQQGRAAFDVERFDHACHGGRWGTTSILIDTATGYDDYVGRVRFLWREFAHEDPRVSEADIAEIYLKAVTDRLVPPHQVDEVKGLFEAKQNQLMQLSNGAVLSYTFKQQPKMGVHRIEIRAAQQPNGEQ